MKQVSIIMLAYNRPEYMRSAIKSVLSQENVDFEFILVDNGSNAETKEVCRDVISSHPEIIFVARSDSNIGAGRNAGIAKSSGEFITFVDDDDYFDCDMMSFLYNNAKSSDSDISVCGCYFDISGIYKDYYVYEGTFIYEGKDGVTELLKREKYNSANPCKLFHNSLFREISYKEEGNYDDIHTLYRLFSKSKRTITNGTPKYYFVKHTNNNSGFLESNRLTNEILQEYFSAFRERSVYLTALFPDMADFYRYTEWSYMISMIDKINTNHLTECAEQEEIAKNYLLKHFEEFSSSKYLKPFERVLLNEYIEETYYSSKSTVHDKKKEG